MKPLRRPRTNVMCPDNRRRVLVAAERYGFSATAIKLGTTIATLMAAIDGYQVRHAERSKIECGLNELERAP